MLINKIINLDPEWIVGFTDAEGHFSVIKNRNTVRCRFMISQDVRSIHVLREIKTYFGVGNVHAGGTMYAYTVEESRALDRVIIPFFEKHTLQTQKYYDWLKLKYAVQTKVSKRKITKSEVANSATIEDWKKQAIPNRTLTAGFIGFADGESCFTVSIVKKQVSPQFIIGLHGRDRVICERIQSFLNCGIVYHRKNGVVVFQISKLEDLINGLRPLFYIAGRFHTLRTHKRSRASLFWRIVNYLQDGLHLNSKGRAQIKQWKEKMRFPKKLQEEEKVRPLA